jgi:hypothetical protein
VLFGAASGPVPPVDAQQLNAAGSATAVAVLFFSGRGLQIANTLK